MDRIDKYLNSIYRDVSGSSKETEDLKQEMRAHLIETVKELQENGVNEEESFRIAIERFGEEIQIRNELNEVIKFQKLFAKKTLKASVLLGLSALLLITAFFINLLSERKLSAMGSQIQMIERKLESEGITGVDTYVKKLFKDEKNNHIAFIIIKELPQDFDITNSPIPEPGDIKYSYPEDIEREIYLGSQGSEVVSDGIRYFLEIGNKTSANKDSSSFLVGLAILAFTICWVLLIVWSIISVYRYGYLNAGWCTLIILTGIIGYFIFIASVNPNKVVNNIRNKVICACLISFAAAALVLSCYFLSGPYRIAILSKLIFR